MVYILWLLIVVLLIVVVVLGFQNSKIKQQHYSNMAQLQGIISSLHQKQMLLKDKVTIASEYNFNYAKDMKNLGDEVVELQKVFLEIINNKN
jgi:predicted negative regulator of RcsB-dependent stress response